jgi:transcriptional regulator with XRE-family HTH domain
MAAGRWASPVDSRPVHEHLRLLRARGVGLDRIAAVSGVHVSTVKRILREAPSTPARPSRVRADTAAAILAVNLDETAADERARVAAAATAQRLQQLLSAGYQLGELASLLGRTPSSLRRTMHSATVTRRTAADVAALAERLGSTKCPSPVGVSATMSHSDPAAAGTCTP